MPSHLVLRREKDGLALVGCLRDREGRQDCPVMLEVPWDAGVLDYAENSRRRGRINTPSYNQVTEPVHTRARGRWVRYRDHMAEPLKTLSPWIRSFGYDGPDDPGTGTG